MGPIGAPGKNAGEATGQAPLAHMQVRFHHRRFIRDTKILFFLFAYVTEYGYLHKIMAKLEAEGVIGRGGAGRNGHWEVKD